MFRKRFSRISRILTASVLPVQARLQLLSLALKRRLVSFDEFAIDLGMGRAFLSGDNSYIDYTVFYDVFLEEYYNANYQDKLVIDIGSHKGYYGAYAFLRGAKKVYSFEPEERNFQFLSKVAHTFESCQWVTRKSAVGSYDGEIDFYVTDQSWSHSIFQRQDRELKKIVKVPVQSFTSIMQEISGSDAEHRIIVKINAEGAECDIILKTPVEYWKLIDELFFTFESATYQSDQIVNYLKQAGLVLAERNRGNVFHLKQ